MNINHQCYYAWFIFYSFTSLMVSWFAFSCCGAGTAADTEMTTNMIASQLELHRLNTGRRARVCTANRMLKQFLFRYQVGVWSSWNPDSNETILSVLFSSCQFISYYMIRFSICCIFLIFFRVTSVQPLCWAEWTLMVLGLCPSILTALRTAFHMWPWAPEV